MPLISAIFSHDQAQVEILTLNISYSEDELPRLLFFQLSKLLLVSVSVALRLSISVSALRWALEVFARAESLDADTAFNSAT